MNLKELSIFIGAFLGALVGIVVSAILLILIPDMSGWYVIADISLCATAGAVIYYAQVEH